MTGANWLQNGTKFNIHWNDNRETVGVENERTKFTRALLQYGLYDPTDRVLKTLCISKNPSDRKGIALAGDLQAKSYNMYSTMEILGLARNCNIQNRAWDNFTKKLEAC